MNALKDQHVLILGLGISGLAMARWCVRHGAVVTVADTRAAPPHLPTLQTELPGVRFVAGDFTAALVDGQNLTAVYRSPGLSPELRRAMGEAAVKAAQAIGYVGAGTVEFLLDERGDVAGDLIEPVADHLFNGGAFTATAGLEVFECNVKTSQ